MPFSLKTWMNLRDYSSRSSLGCGDHLPGSGMTVLRPDLTKPDAFQRSLFTFKFTSAISRIYLHMERFTNTKAFRNTKINYSSCFFEKKSDRLKIRSEMTTKTSNQGYKQKGHLYLQIWWFYFRFHCGGPGRWLAAQNSWLFKMFCPIFFDIWTWQKQKVGKWWETMGLFSI